jgi:hypothetical protein
MAGLVVERAVAGEVEPTQLPSDVGDGDRQATAEQVLAVATDGLRPAERQGVRGCPTSSAA